MDDKIVFDIETKTPFATQDTIKLLEASVVGVYSYLEDKYYCFEEKEFGRFGEMARRSNLIIGFASKRFDVPVMEKYFNFNLSAIPQYDILEEIESSFGQRMGLGVLAGANLNNINKSGKGLDAVEYWRNGEIEKLKSYCLQDVKVTKEIYDLMRRQGYLWIPDRNAVEMSKAYFHFEPEEESSQARLL
jgi:DEAD/DEAH box helicase domain-containing protein